MRLKYFKRLSIKIHSERSVKLFLREMNSKGKRITLFEKKKSLTQFENLLYRWKSKDCIHHQRIQVYTCNPNGIVSQISRFPQSRDTHSTLTIHHPLGRPYPSPVAFI